MARQQSCIKHHVVVVIRRRSINRYRLITQHLIRSEPTVSITAIVYSFELKVLVLMLLLATTLLVTCGEVRRLNGFGISQVVNLTADSRALMLVLRSIIGCLVIHETMAEHVQLASSQPALLFPLTRVTCALSSARSFDNWDRVVLRRWVIIACDIV